MNTKVKKVPVDLVEAPAKHFSEAYQSSKIQFAFCKRLRAGEYREMHYPTKCRDFLGDVLFSEEQGRGIEIYNFSWNPEKQKIDRDKVRFSITFPNKDSLFNFNANQIILTDVNKYVKRLAVIIPVKDNPLKLIVEADKIWQSSVMLISLFSFVLKIMAYPFKVPADWLNEFPKTMYNDSQYYKGKEANFIKILENLEKFSKIPSVSGWNKVADLNDNFIHDKSGFSFCLKSNNEDNLNVKLLGSL